MAVVISQVFLLEVETNELVEADLYDQILPRHLEHYQEKWLPVKNNASEEHTHWDWNTKHISPSGHRSFAIECEGETQGLMIVVPRNPCRLPEHEGQNLVYVDYLESAPWNRPVIQFPPTYRLVGTVLVAAAIKLSLDLGEYGRIGLHSLPQAERFYREKCVMSGLGIDNQYSELRYFEMTEEQAVMFMSDERQ